MATPCKVNSLTDIFDLMASNPSLASALKSYPAEVAAQFGVTLTTQQESDISENLDLSMVNSWASQVNTYAAKVEQGIGLS